MYLNLPMAKEFSQFNPGPSSSDSFNSMGQPPYPAPPPRQNTGLIIGIIAAVVAIPMLLICIGILVALLLPAVQAAREAARRMQCSNNMKQIALAMFNYESTYRTFPPAFTTDQDGQPLHSWRTLILPYMEQQALYSQIDLAKPWDDPVNLPFASIVIPAYACPSAQVDAPEKTCYQVVVDQGGVFAGASACKLGSITDGTSNTLLVVETEPYNAVPWMSPRDTNLSGFLNRNQAGRSAHTHGANVAMADGSVRFLSDDLDQASAAALVSKGAGDSVMGL